MRPCVNSNLSSSYPDEDLSSDQRTLMKQGVISEGKIKQIKPRDVVFEMLCLKFLPGISANGRNF